MSSHHSSEIAKRFVGAWRYVEATLDGKPPPGRGTGKGMIYYDPSGVMVVQVAPDRARHRAGSEPTAQEAKDALTGYVAYFGTYTVDEQARTVTHHRQGSVQPGDVADLVRGYEFVGRPADPSAAGLDLSGRLGTDQVRLH